MTVEQSLLDLLSIQMKCEYLDGYSDGTFQPNKTISRAEVTAIVNRMLGRVADETYIRRNEDELNTFHDLQNPPLLGLLRPDGGCQRPHHRHRSGKRDLA